MDDPDRDGKRRHGCRSDVGRAIDPERGGHKRQLSFVQSSLATGVLIKVEERRFACNEFHVKIVLSGHWNRLGP
jgi:hypothetical protein